MNAKADRMLIVGFVAVLLISMLTFFLWPVQRFSELENRYLQTVPQFSWEGIISHQFSDDTERYIADQFPLRERWISLKSISEQLRGQRENNGIYKGKDGYLFEKFNAPNYSDVASYIDAINLFAERHPSAHISFMLAPNSIGLYAHKLPWKATTYPQKEVNMFVAEHLDGSVSFMDGFDFLSEHTDEQLYFRNDHHWTTYGAYLAYVAYAEHVGWEPYLYDDFDIKTVSDSFLGSYHTRSQFSGLTPDVIQAYMPRHPVNTTMYIADSNKTLDSLYDESFLQKKDQYAYFLGGVHGLMELHTVLDREAIAQEKLLIIKDSYAHNVIPFLTLHVPNIHVIDIRFYNGSIHNYMAEHRFDDVLILFNTTTFVDNTAILKFKS